MSRLPLNQPISVCAIAIFVLGATVGLNSYSSLAQSAVIKSGSSNEVAEQFLRELIGVDIAQRRYHSDVYFVSRKDGPVSEKSKREVGDHWRWLEMNMASQMEEPHFQSQIVHSNDQIAHVKVVRSEVEHPHEVVLLREGGLWKVDLIATYAAWNNLNDSQAKKRIRSMSASDPFGQQ